jgi:hypothetical protein
MVKRRTRQGQRELNRAEVKAIERRAAVPVAAEPGVTLASADTLTDAPVTPEQRGVLPPRPSRLAVAGHTLSREQEMAYIRGDLRRLTVLTGLMLAILAILAVVIR